jgi:hypothetical protein
MSDTPDAGLGGLPSMMDSLEFVKRAWSGFNVPTSFAPTLDVGELDQRIADLRAVEQWLSMNLNLLQASIRGMEIQRSTLVTVRAFGQAVAGSSNAMAQAAQEARESSRPQATASPAVDDSQPSSTSVGASPPQLPTGTTMVDPAAWWQLLQGQFSQVAQAALSGAGAREALERTASSMADLAARAGLGGHPSAPSPEPRKGTDAPTSGHIRRAAKTANNAPTGASPTGEAASATHEDGNRVAGSGKTTSRSRTGGRKVNRSGATPIKRRGPARLISAGGAMASPARRAIRRRPSAGH